MLILCYVARLLSAEMGIFYEVVKYLMDMRSTHDISACVLSHDRATYYINPSVEGWGYWI